MAGRYNPEIHHRQSIRLKGYEYSRPGAYFVTICTNVRECLFGDVNDGQMQLNGAGQMIEKWWLELTNKFPTIEMDSYVVMPNHFHGIITVVHAANPVANANVGADLCVRPGRKGAHAGAPLPRMVQWFKTMTTNAYIRGIKQNGWRPFPGRLWQRNYYEHIIRTDDELIRIRQYIRDNPMGWLEDWENPLARVTKVEEPWRV